MNIPEMILRRSSTFKRSGLLIGAVLIVCGLFFAPALTPQAAADPGYGYRWTLDLSFGAGFNGVLTVEAGAGTVGALDKVYATEQFVVPCKPVGIVNLGGGSAIFDGGHVACDFNLGRAIAITFDSCAAVEPSCKYTVSAREAYPAFLMSAHMTSTQPGMAPLIHLPDASFSADVGGAQVELANDLNPVGSSAAVFTPFSPLGKWHKYVSHYSCVGGAPCSMTYEASGTSLPGGPGPFVERVQLRTGAVQLYIGHDPDTGDTLPTGTKVNHIHVDPNMGNN